MPAKSVQQVWLLVWLMLAAICVVTTDGARHTADSNEGGSTSSGSTKKSSSPLSYAQALRLAQKGKVNRAVVNAMRKEHLKAEKSGPTYFRVEVMLNLGVALMQLGNSSPDPQIYSPIYDESESLFLSALKLHPDHSGAKQNLISVRRNISVRPRANTIDSDSSMMNLGAEASDAVMQNEDSQEEMVFDEKDDSPLMTYDEALQQAVRGQLDMRIVKSMRKELILAEQKGDIEHLVSVKVNLGTVLLNLANQADNRNIAEFLSSYLESEKLLESALAMQPSNPRAISNLATVQRNFLMRERLKLLNPHMTWLGHSSCKNVVLQRLQKQQFSATMFTCDDRTDRGLLWTFHAADTNVEDWVSSFRERSKSRRELAYDARSLMWRGDLCWISAVAEWLTETEYMLFHCISKDHFVQQMDQSHRNKQLKPLLHAKGGMIIADRLQQTEKNWSPFVVGDNLYITYRTRPHIVMQCDWDTDRGLLRCDIVQNIENNLVPKSWGSDDLRGSSTAVPLPNSQEFLALGHMKSSSVGIKYRFYFYKFVGKDPPFQVTEFSKLFTILPANASFQYAHGLSIAGDEMVITYGLGDDASWYVNVPLVKVLPLFQRETQEQHSVEVLVASNEADPREFTTTLFGKGVEENLLEMEGVLRQSSHVLAGQVLSFLNRSTTLSLEEYLTEARKYIGVYLQSNMELEELIQSCPLTGEVDFEGSTCSREITAGTAEADAQIAFMAYVTILTRENRVVKTILARGETDRSPSTKQHGTAEEPMDRLNRRSRGKSVSALPYKEALRLAQAGKLSEIVVEAMRREVADADANGAIFRRVDVKINLGVALLNLGNNAGDPAVYTSMYKESEDMFLAALALHPGHTGAESNLAVLRKNQNARPKFDGSTTTPQARNGMRTTEFTRTSSVSAEKRKLSNGGGFQKEQESRNLGFDSFDDEDDNESPHEDFASGSLNSPNSKASQASPLSYEDATMQETQRTPAKHIIHRQNLELFNPHMMWIGHKACNHVVLRRMEKGQLTTTLFTCDLKTDRGLLWISDAENISAEEWKSSFQKNRKLRRALAEDARAVLWRGELCWISGTVLEDWTHMQFHCVSKDRFLRQMDRSHREQKMLPLLHVRGALIVADRRQRIEKNWSPFVIGDTLYMTYMIQPHIVMQCNLEQEREQLQCITVQHFINHIVPLSWGSVELRGSSNSILLPGTESEFLAIGYVKKGSLKRDYFFYKFLGSKPPFQLTEISKLFSILSDKKEDLGYAQGLHIQSGHVIVTYELNDETAWYMEIPLKSVLLFFQGGESPQPETLISKAAEPPTQIPSSFFGQSMEAILNTATSSLQVSGHDSARKALLLLNQSSSMSLDTFMTECYSMSQAYFQSMKKMEQKELDCESATADEKGMAACLNDLDHVSAKEDLERSYEVVLSVLAHENRHLASIVSESSVKMKMHGIPAGHEHSRGQVKGMNVLAGEESAGSHKDPREFEDEIQPESRREIKQDIANSRTLSYTEALKLAQSGKVTEAVVNAMRQELADAEQFGPVKYRLEVNTNLGVALMQHGNQAVDPVVYSRIYAESEMAFLSALALQSDHAPAKRNLEALRKNRGLRPTVDDRSINGKIKDSSGESGASSMEGHGQMKKSKRRTVSIIDDDEDEIPEGAALDERMPTLLTYGEALQQAMNGRVDMDIVNSFRAEHRQAEQLGNVNHVVTVKINLGAALLNLANKLSSSVEMIELYVESERVLKSALDIEPGNPRAIDNLRMVQANIGFRQNFELFNPHMMWIGHKACNHVVLRRMEKGQLTTTLFTCDLKTDRGLLWISDAENISAEEWKSSFQKNRKLRRALAEDARAVLWRGELCWISCAVLEDGTHMQFHCVSKDRFLRQMDRSHREQKMLPLLHVRGGLIVADRRQRIEKNWSPFVIGDTLYMTYMTRPHIVMQCEWAPRGEQLECVSVQSTRHSLVPLSWGSVELRGSSAAIPLPGSQGELLAAGHLKDGLSDFRFFFYTFSGSEPPFQLSGISRLFTVAKAEAGKLEYIHGLCIEGDELIVTYGVGDVTSWLLKVPLDNIFPLFRAEEIRKTALVPLISKTAESPMEFPTALFGQPLQDLLQGMEESVRRSDSSIAQKVIAKLDEPSSFSLKRYLSSVFKHKSVFTQAISMLEVEDLVCEEQTEPDTMDRCMRELESSSTVLEAELAYWAYVTLLAQENMIVKSIIETEQNPPVDRAGSRRSKRKKPRKSQGLVQDQYSDPDHARPSAGSENSPAEEVKRRRSEAAMSYAEAMRIARSGGMNDAVADAIRREHAAAEASGPGDVSDPDNRLLEVKVNLGVALMQLGNQAGVPAGYDRLYEESESVLLSALRLVPDHAGAERNLEKLRRNRQLRQVDLVGKVGG